MSPNHTQWPREGCCGACSRPAIEFPSGRWEHKGAPCRARSQSIWRIDDVGIKASVVFVADGEPLPVEPKKPHWHTTATNADGFPTELGWCQADHMPSIREWLAAEAEAREAAS